MKYTFFLIPILLLSGCDPVFAAPCQDKVCIRVYTDPKTGRVVIEANRGKGGATSTPKVRTPNPTPTRTWKPRPYTPRPYTPRPKVTKKPLSLADQISKLIPGGVINKEPAGDVLVQVPVKFSTNTNSYFQTAATILGTLVQVNLTPHFVWDFGDGSSISNGEAIVEHTYLRSGEYLVALQVSWTGDWVANNVLSPITGGAIVKTSALNVSVHRGPTKYVR
mgnify:CR=1 FL=1